MEKPENRVLLKKLWIVALGMFGFGFLMVPFYNKICEVTGINSGDTQVLAKNTQVDTSRTITLEFDANVDARLPWKFTPVQNSIRMHPGEMVEVLYEVENLSDRDITGQAIPSYGPQLAGQYVKKIECFCFTGQTLKAHEKKRMPVMMVMDPSLPADVNTVTLSYTFFVQPGAEKAAQGGKPAKNG
ncbi:MAG: cytochrome c oxidase assembly protein [Pseudomonadota bacterium]